MVVKTIKLNGEAELGVSSLQGEEACNLRVLALQSPRLILAGSTFCFSASFESPCNEDSGVSGSLGTKSVAACSTRLGIS